MAKFKKFRIKSFTLPEGKYIINSDKSITVKELVVEMKSIPAKKYKPSNTSKQPKWFKDFVETKFDPFVKETRDKLTKHDDDIDAIKKHVGMK